VGDYLDAAFVEGKLLLKDSPCPLTIQYHCMGKRQDSPAGNLIHETQMAFVGIEVVHGIN
jgi:hypothetical protein